MNAPVNAATAPKTEKKAVYVRRFESKNPNADQAIYRLVPPLDDGTAHVFVSSIVHTEETTKPLKAFPLEMQGFLPKPGDKETAVVKCLSDGTVLNEVVGINLGSLSHEETLAKIGYTAVDEALWHVYIFQHAEGACDVWEVMACSEDDALEKVYMEHPDASFSYGCLAPHGGEDCAVLA